MFYSKKVGGFLPVQWVLDGTFNPVPDDAIELTEDEVREFRRSVPKGKKIDVINGKLSWADITPLSLEELIREADRERKQRIDAAHMSVSLSQLKLLAGRAITGDEKERLNCILDYIEELELIDTSKAKDIVWPKHPFQN